MDSTTDKDDDNLWDAFGNDDDEDDDKEGDDCPQHHSASTSGTLDTAAAAADRVASFLAKVFFWNKKSIKLGIKRHVGIVIVHDKSSESETKKEAQQQQETTWATTLVARGFAVTTTVVAALESNDKTIDTMLGQQQQEPLDAVVWVSTTAAPSMSRRFVDEKDEDQKVALLLSCMQRAIVPGGVIIVPSLSSFSLNLGGDDKDDTSSSSNVWDESLWKIHEAETIYEYPSSSSNQTNNNDDSHKTCCCCCLVAVTKRACPIQSSLPTCTWLPLHYDIEKERQRVHQATIALSAAEVKASKLVETSLEQAVQALQEYGYCILLRLLDNTARDLPMIHAWGQAARDDLHEAARILKQRDNVDLYHPQESMQEPASYREMSMREDFRMDLRHGPRLSQLRTASVKSNDTTAKITSEATKNSDNDDVDIDIDNDDENDGNQPWIVRATTPLPGAITGQDDDDDECRYHAGYFSRGHVDILEIVRRVMNPSNPHLSRGNFGRYNFSGSGPDGSFQNLRVSPVGAILSLPGSADQAIHADTPHLYEHVSCLPAHYINVFTPASAAARSVGQTALVHASHTLEVCVRYMNDDDNDNHKHASTTADKKNGRHDDGSWKDFLVRPALDLGDVLLFDCRILHFGLANSSDSGIERPLLYANMTQHWFHDPKNWQNQRPIFGGQQQQQQQPS